MKTKTFLFCVLLFCLSGCKIAKAVGESLGFGGGNKTEQVQKTVKTPDGTIISPNGDKVAITSKTISNLFWYSVITLIVLFAIRYGMKKFSQRNKNE